MRPEAPTAEELHEKVHRLPVVQHAAMVMLVECMLANPGMKLPDPERVARALVEVEVGRWPSGR